MDGNIVHTNGLPIVDCIFQRYNQETGEDEYVSQEIPPIEFIHLNHEEYSGMPTLVIKTNAFLLFDYREINEVFVNATYKALNVNTGKNEMCNILYKARMNSYNKQAGFVSKKGTLGTTTITFEIEDFTITRQVIK